MLEFNVPFLRNNAHAHELLFISPEFQLAGRIKILADHRVSENRIQSFPDVWFLRIQLVHVYTLTSGDVVVHALEVVYDFLKTIVN